MSRRVVILGSGAAVLPGSYGIDSFDKHFEKMTDGISGISALEEPTKGPRVSVTHSARVISADAKYFPKHLNRHAWRSIAMSLFAANLATAGSGLPRDDYAIDTAALGILPYDIATWGGSGYGDADAYNHFYEWFLEGSWRKIGGQAVQATMPNGPATTVALMLGARGKSDTSSTACTSSSDAFGNMFWHVQRGHSKLGIVVGVDTLDNPYFHVLFGLPRALSKRGRSIPFGKGRDGFVMGEGAAVAFLAGLDEVKQWGLEHSILAEVVGYGATCDAQNMVNPSAESGAAAVLQAMNQAYQHGFTFADIGFWSAHGTSTPVGDLNEAIIMDRVLKQTCDVCSSKAFVGHTIGAAGLIGILFAGHVIKTGIIPSMGTYPIDPECAFPYVRYATAESTAEMMKVGAIATSFGFGGQNAAIVLGKYEG